MINVCGNLYPISLLSQKLCKVLAQRLEELIPSIVEQDQNGFIEGGQGFHNVRDVVNIIRHQKGTDTALLSLDVEKSVWVWVRLLRVRLLFIRPIVKTLTNNTSEPTTISRGCSQGCPSSPLFFILALEPFVI